MHHAGSESIGQNTSREEGKDPAAQGFGLTGVFDLYQNGLAFSQAEWQHQRDKMWCCKDTYTEFDWFPCSVACEHSGFDVCKG